MIVIWFSYFKSKTTTGQNIFGQRVTVEYFDQNYHFETIFPINGILTNKIKIDNGEYYVVELDKSFTYDNLEYKKIIIKERHVGYHIGIDNEVHVHVLLPKAILNKESYSLDQFDHVVWAIVTSDKIKNKRK